MGVLTWLTFFPGFLLLLLYNRVFSFVARWDGTDGAELGGSVGGARSIYRVCKGWLILGGAFVCFVFFFFF